MGKKVAVLGSGQVGKTLAEGFSKHGYEVKQGSRNQFRELAAWGDLLVLAVKGTVANAALEMSGEENLAGKTIIDATNPIAEATPENGVLKFFTNLDESLMERLQKQSPKAKLVKAFSSVGNAMMVNPNYGGVRPTMFICGNDDAAKQEVQEVLQKFGWDSEDMGAATAARALEPLCMLWCIPGFRSNSWTHSFKLLKQPN